MLARAVPLGVRMVMGGGLHGGVVNEGMTPAGCGAEVAQQAAGWASLLWPFTYCCWYEDAGSGLPRHDHQLRS